MIQKHVRDMADAAARKGQIVFSDPDAVVELFDIYPANEWMVMETEHETPQMLFGNFWLQGELCILFADTNMGKSLLAVQLADSISRGEPIAPFALGADASPVLYIDFELSGKQFEQRYTDGQNRYHFATEFYRGEYNQFNRASSHYQKLDKYVIEALTRGIKRTGAEVLIIEHYLPAQRNRERRGCPHPDEGTEKA
ncbi:AAA family ATPase [Mucilaginibacter rubeus]|uniref:AAA family ATPase n=2 Tax=Mucilaginibacter rubeus TaxID=2027860 RepID=A0A5C1IAA6_9SPHI|nr:AAA family ATPase [Mucilaginibacter rubeus]